MGNGKTRRTYSYRQGVCRLSSEPAYGLSCVSVGNQYKVRLGRLSMASDLERNFLFRMREAGYGVLPIEVNLALRAGRLSGEHGDPFDRMIAAQALELDIPVIGSDAKLDSFGVRRIW